MFEKLFSYRYVVYWLTITGILASLYCFYLSPKSIFPPISRPTLYLQIPLDHYSQQEFIQHYGKSLEQSLSALTGNIKVKHVKAQYYEHLASYEVQFRWTDSTQQARLAVETLIEKFKSSWPDRMREGIQLKTNKNDNINFLLLTFSSKKHSDEKLYQILQEKVTSSLQGLQEVGLFKILPVNQKSIGIKIDPYLATEYDIDYQNLRSALSFTHSSSNIAQFYLDKKGVQFQYEEKNYSLDSLKKTLIKTQKGTSVPLEFFSDIKETDLSAKSLKYNGRNAVLAQLSPAEKVDIYTAVTKAKKTLSNLFSTDPALKDIHYHMILDPSDVIDESLSHVLKEIIFCAAIAAGILFLFIGKMSSVSPVLLEIPLSLLLSFIFFYVFGIHINLISLGGLALSIGMNVDASIVVIDSLTQKLKKLPDSLSKTQLIQTLAHAIGEVFMPLTLATLSSIIVFVPLFFTSKMTFAIMGDMALAVVISHTLSLLVSLILIPALRYEIFCFRKTTIDNRKSPSLFEPTLKVLYHLYLRSLKYFLTHRTLRFVSLIVFLFCFLFSFLIIPTKLEKEIMSDPKGKYLTLVLQSNNQENSLKELENYTTHLVKSCQEKFPQIKGIYQENLHFYGQSIMIFLLKTEKVFQSLETFLENENKKQNMFRQSIDHYNPSKIPLSKPFDWEIRLSNTHQKDLRNFEENVYYALKDHQALKEILSDKDHNSAMKKKTLSPIKEINALFSPHFPREHLKAQTTSLLSMMKNFSPLGKICFEDQETEVILYSGLSEQNLSSLLGLPIKIQNEIFPLRAFYEVSAEKTAEIIFRQNNTYQINLQGMHPKKGDNLKDILKACIETAENKDKENLTDYKIYDYHPETREALSQLIVCGIFSLLMIALFMFLRLQSLSYTFVILMTTPFALLGVLLGLFLTDTPLCLNALLGTILLNGISVSNSIFILEQYLVLKKENSNIMENILMSLKTRLQPILMTSLTTAFGMLPIAIGIGENSQVLQPLGIAVSWGLWVSLIFTLYFVPWALFSLEKK